MRTFLQKCFDPATQHVQLHGDVGLVRGQLEIRGPRKASKDDLNDDEWLHVIGPKKWVICSHDKKWQDEGLAVAAIKQHKIGCLYLYGANSKHFFKVGSLAYNLHKVQSILGKQRRPFIYAITPRNRLKKIL